MQFLANQLDFCPFPHRQREFGWLAVGVVLGATIMHYRTKKKYETKLTRNFLTQSKLRDYMGFVAHHIMQMAW